MKPIDMKIDTPRATGRFLQTRHTRKVVSVVWDTDRLASEGRFSFIKKGASTAVGVLYGKPFGIPFDMLVKRDRKSTRLSCSHGYISYAVFCLTKRPKRQARRPAPLSVPAGCGRTTPASRT